MRNVVRLLGLNSKNVISINVGRDNFINLLLLSFVYAVYFLLLTIAMYLPGGVLESEETIIFVQGWVTVPILSLLTMVIVHRYKNVGNENDGFFYPVFLFSNYTLCFMFTVGLMLGWWLFSSPIQLPRLVNAILVFFPLLQLALLWALKKYRLFWISIVREKTIQSLYGILPHIIVVFIASFSSRLEIIAVSLATICLAILFNLLPKHFFVSSKKLIRWMPLLLDTMAILLIIGACFDPKIAVSIYNQNFYLGPVNALLHGRIILVNVFSQYGVLALEFVALVFKMGLVPLSYQGFSFLVALLSMFQYAVIYILLRSILKSPWLSFFALSVILLINFFATADFFQAYPSIGPLRFGLSYLMALLFMLYYKYPSINPVFVFFAYVVLGVASLWSFEAFIYVAFMFLGMVIYQSIIMNGQDLSKIVRSVLYGLLFAVLSIGICQAIMAGVVFAQTSEWPKWGYYFAYIFLYQGGFGSMPVDPWSPWFLMIAAYFLCLSSYVIKWLVE